MARFRAHMLLALAAGPALLCLQLFADGQEEPDEGRGSVRIRESYVPYEEFRELTGSDEDGIVMTLKEYRELVLRAVGNLEEKEVEPGLPPIAASIQNAAYTGEAQGKTARFRGVLKVKVAKEGWVRCPLGASIPHLGRVVVDDAPGWILLDKTRQRFHLLLKGKGGHRVDICFSLGISKEEELSVLKGILIPAASSRLELEVPGEVEAHSKPPVLQSVKESGSTRLILACGTAKNFSLKWKQKRAPGDKDLFLSAKHLVSYAARRHSPVFKWSTTVTAARRKIEDLYLKEPPGTRTLTLKGPLVHSWQREKAAVKVILKEGGQGKIHIHGSGIMEKPGAGYTFGVPSLLHSYVQTGYLALYEPPDSELSVLSKSLLKEASVPESGAEPAYGAPEAAGKKARIFKVYSYTSPDARIEVNVEPLELEFETHGSYVARITEGNVIVKGVFCISVRKGRLYRASVSIKKPWKISLLKEHERKGSSSHAVAADINEKENSTTIAISLGKAVCAGQTVQFQIRLQLAGFPEPGGGWNRTPLSIDLPEIAGSERNRYDLGVTIPESMDAMMQSAADWRFLHPEEAKKHGIFTSADPDRRKLVASLTKRGGPGRLDLTLVHRAPRGEYCAVTHLLACERTLRVRTDLRVKVVDRPVEALIFSFPFELPSNVAIIGSGITEVKTENGSKTVRFAKPWLGTRQFRIEYESKIKPGTPIAVPVLQVDSKLEDSYFASKRFLVLQSKGPVEVEPPESKALRPGDFGDLPEFTVPWERGRVLKVYRCHGKGSPGTIKTTVHDRAPVLRKLGREVKLKTVVSREGVSRTRAEILLAYSREQDFKVELPPGARCLSVTVNGEPVRAVLLPEEESPKPAGKEAGHVVAVPLPPRSYASVTITYQIPGCVEKERGPGCSSPLRKFGTWSEPALKLLDIPVGKIVWHVYYPRSYIFHVLRSSDLKAADRTGEERYGTFAESFFAPLFSGESPVFTTFRGVHPPGELVRVPDLTPAEMQGAGYGHASSNKYRIQAQEFKDVGFLSTQKAAAPLYSLLPQGRRVEAAKAGGGGSLELGYASETWWSSSKKAVFWAVLLIGALLFIHGRRKLFWNLLFWGLFLGTLVPFVLNRGSPLLIVPLCEALIVALFVFGIYTCLELFVCKVLGRLRRAKAPSKRTALGSVSGLLFAAVISGFYTKADAASSAQEGLPLDGAVIPYDSHEFGKTGGAPEKAYLPYPKFLKLWRLAYPEEQVEEEAPPRSIVVGNAEYTLKVRGDSSHITGLIDINVLTGKWVTVPLPFDGSRIVRVSVDGKETGVSQGPAEAGGPLSETPFIELKGKGVRKLRFEIKAPVHTQSGLYKILTGLLAEHAATLRAELPAGAEVKLISGQPKAAKRLPVSVTGERNKTLLVAHLGAANRIELLWSFPKVEGKRGSQVESLSYSSLQLSPAGYKISRAERIRVTGRAVDTLEYEFKGNWLVKEVSGSSVSEWSVLEASGEDKGKRLQVFFARPVNKADLMIRGRALMDKSAPFATLSLTGAVKQETFAGLHHSRLRRFASGVLSGMQRASRKQLLRFFPVPGDEMPDRIYHVYGSGAGEILKAEAVPADVQINTDIVFVLELRRLVVSARSTYKVTGPGPLRHEVVLPDGFSVRTVRCGELGDWKVAGSNAKERLVFEFPERLKTGTGLVWTIERSLAEVPESITLPVLASIVPGATKKREIRRWAFASNDEFNLRVEDRGGRIPVSVDSVPKWIELPPLTSYRLALRTSRSEPQGPVVLSVKKRPSLLSATLVSLLRVTEDFLHVNARVNYRMRMAGRKRFRLALPQGAELVSLETPNQQSREVRPEAEGTRIEMVLQSKTAGTHPVDISYRVPHKRGREIVVMPVRLFDGKQRLEKVNQYVGLLKSSSKFIFEASSSGLMEVDPESLPDDVSTAGLGSAYRASKLDWSLSLREETVEIVEGPAAIVELAELTTFVGTDGTTRTNVTYTVKNRNLQFLVLEIPPGADLWGVTLNGRPAAVGKAAYPEKEEKWGQALRIPVEYVGSASLDLEVCVKYEQKRMGLPALRQSAALSAPRIHDTKVVETIWNVFFPVAYRVSLSDGNMREVPSSMQHAKKVKNLLKQYRKISRTLSETGSESVRNRAIREMSRLEKVLGDNVTELMQRNRSEAERAQSRRIGQEAVEQQWEANDRLIRKSRKVQKALREARRSSSKRKREQGGFERERGVFLEAEDSFKGWWQSGGYPFPRERRPQSPTAKGGGFKLDELTEGGSFAGLKGFEETAGPSEVERVKPEPVKPGKGLQPLREDLRSETAPGFEVRSEPKDSFCYTFLRSGGDAEIEITFTSKRAIQRLAASALLVLVPLFLLLLLRKRRA